MDGTGLQAIATPLAPFVTRLVAYDMSGEAGVHRGMPSTGLTVVFPVDDPIDVAWDDGEGHCIDWSTVSGLHTRSARIRHDGRQRGIQLTLSIPGARALFGLPAAALSRQLLTVDDLTGPVRDLPEQLHDLATWPERVALVQRVLADEVQRLDATPTRTEIGWALDRLTLGDAVGDVAAEVGFSRRRLSTLVRDETGVSPKQWSRLARFERSQDLVADAHTTGDATLADVAAAAGYADHAHLTREWRDLAGCTPTTWLAEEFPNVQALDLAAG